MTLTPEQQTPQTVGALIRALQEFDPETPVVTPAPAGDFGHLRIGERTLQERARHPRGEGRFVPWWAGQQGENVVGPQFDAVTLAWENDQPQG